MAHLFEKMAKASQKSRQKELINQLMAESTNQLFLIELWGQDDYYPPEKILSLEMYFPSNEKALAFAQTLKEHFDFPTCIGWTKVHNVAEVLRNNEINSSVALYIEQRLGKISG